MIEKMNPRSQLIIHMKTILISLIGAAISGRAFAAPEEDTNAQLRTIYSAEWKWRLEQFPGLEGPTKPVPDRLPKVDSGTQETWLHYWEDVLRKLDAIPRTELSQEEQINYDVYRPEIENFVADQKFRDYEMPLCPNDIEATELLATDPHRFSQMDPTNSGICVHLCQSVA